METVRACNIRFRGRQLTTAGSSKIRNRYLANACGGILVAALSAAALSACKTHSLSQVISPAVTGRVVDARTRQPIQGVKVERETGTGQPSNEPMKGAQIIQQAPAIRTDEDGTFTLPCIRDLVLFRTVGFDTVRILFEHPAYQRYSTEYTQAQATNRLNGDPVIRAGDIALTAK